MLERTSDKSEIVVRVYVGALNTAYSLSITEIIMSTHFDECFDLEEHDEIIVYLQGLCAEMDGSYQDQFMIRETIVHIEFLYNSAKENKMNEQKTEERLMDYFTKASHEYLKQELKESKQITELCYAMLLGSVLLNVVLVWLAFNG